MHVRQGLTICGIFFFFVLIRSIKVLPQMLNSEYIVLLDFDTFNNCIVHAAN